MQIIFESRLLDINETIKPGLVIRPELQREHAYFAHFILLENWNIFANREILVCGGNYMKLVFLSALI